MVNRSNNGARIPRYQRAADALPRLVGPGGSNAGGQVLNRVAGLFADVGNMVDNQLDKVAAIEGREEGALAGADPSYDPQKIANRASIRGQAYERAATQAAIAKMDIGARKGVDELATKFGHDPTLFQQKVGEFRQSFLSGLPDGLRPDADELFGRLEYAGLSAIRRNVRETQRQAARAGLLEQISERRTSIAKLAMEGDDPLLTGASVARELELTEAVLIEAGPKAAFEWNGQMIPADAGRAGLIEPAEMISLLGQAGEEAAFARIMGPFSRLTDPDAMRDMRDQVLATERGKAQASVFDIDDLSRLESKMDTVIRHAEANRAREGRALLSDLKDIETLMGLGHHIDDARIDQITLKGAALGVPEVTELGRNLKGRQAYVDKARLMSLDELKADIEERRAAAGNQITIDQAQMIQMGEKIYANLTKGLASDPLATAAQMGVEPISPLDLNGDIAAQLESRIKQADNVAGHYNIEPVFFMPAERQAIMATIDDLPAAEATAFLGQLHQSFGERAPQAFAEFAKDDPSFAHLGGLASISNAHLLIAGEVMIGRRALAENGDLLPGTDGDRQIEADKVLGQAFGFAPQTRASVIDAADAIFAARRLRSGPSVEKSMSNYGQAIQAAAGGWTDASGTDRGGLASYNGRTVVVPPLIARDDFEDIIQNLTTDDLQAYSVGHTAAIYADGTVMTPDELADLWLVSVGTGQYLVSLTDPEKGMPEWLGGGGPNGRYILDLSEFSR